MPAKPFESTMQDLVYNMDVGAGLQIIKKGLYFLFICILLVVYPYSQFHGFKEAEAMEYAQLGRNLMTHGQLATQCVRPASLWYLTQHLSADGQVINQQKLVDQHPDILHPPLYPALLAVVFKITGVTFALARGAWIFSPEKIITAVNILFTALTGLMVFLLGRRLFDRRAAFLAVTAYFLSDTILDMSISGLGIPLTAFLSISAVYFALVAVSNRQEEGVTLIRWAGPLALSLLFCALAFLTRYGAAVLVPALALFIGWSFPSRKWAWGAGFVLAFLIAISPWLIRNVAVSGGLLGLAPYTALHNSNLYEDQLFDQTAHPSFGGPGRVASALQTKWLATTARALNQTLRTIGDGFFICIFLTMFFHRFVRPQVHRLRWCLALAMAGLLFVGGFFGDATLRLFFIFWPLILLYALAFFLVLLERLQFEIRLFSVATTTAVMALGAAPLVFTLLPPRAGVPYPPYHPPFVVMVSQMLQENELICADMPWATAWYGNRTSLLLPCSLQEFYEIHDYTRKISGLYFTTLTRDKPYARTLLSGPYKSWFPIMEGKIPNDFPLTQGFSLPPNSADQLFLTDRQRWKEP